MTKNDLDAAVRGIMSGPVLFRNFVALPPGPIATDEDHSSAVKALAAHYSALSSSVPLSGWSPSPIPQQADPPAGASQNNEEHIPTPSAQAAPPPAEMSPTSPLADNSILTVTPSLAPDEASLTSGLAQLCSVYPTFSEEFLLTALEKHEYDPVAAMGWLVSVADVNILTAAMTDAFPSAPKRTVNKLVQECGGDLSAVWATLSHSYTSAWTNQFSTSAIQRKSSCSRLLVNDDESDVSEVMVVSNDLRRFESSWWTSVHSARKFRLGTGSLHLPHWDAVCSIACTNSPVSPRFSGHIFSLGLRKKDTNAFKEAVVILRSMPTYKAICESLARLHPAATPIVQILVEDGLSNPGAALWLVLSSSTPDNVFTGFVCAHLSICKKRNKALLAAKLADQQTTTHTPMVINDSDLESVMEVDIMPGLAAAPQSDWESEVVPSKVNRPKNTKKPTGPRKGDRSSTRKAATKASDCISNLSNVSAGTLDHFVTSVKGRDAAGPSRSPAKPVRRSRSGTSGKLKAAPTTASSPFQDS